MTRKIIIEIICVLFILLFFYAAVSKLVSYEKFIGQIGKSSLLTGYAEWIAVALPLIEILICIALVFPQWRITGMYYAFGLMVLFSLYIIAILNSGEAIPCSCGGVLNSLGWKSHLVFNLVFVGLGLWGILLLYKENKTGKNSEV